MFALQRIHSLLHGNKPNQSSKQIMASLSRFIAGRRMSSSLPRKTERFAASIRFGIATNSVRDLASLLAAGRFQASVKRAKSLLDRDHPIVGSVPDLYRALADAAGPDPQPAFLSTAASALVCASALVGHHDGGLRLVSVLASARAPLPSPVSCGHLLRSLVSLRRYADARRAFEILTASGARLHTFAWSSAVEACVMTGDVDEAVRMLRRMGRDDDDDAPRPDTFSYNMVIKGLWKAGRGDDAMKMFNEMADGAVARDDFTYNSMVFGHCMSGDLEAARKLQDQMLQEGLKPNYRITNDAMLRELFRNRRMGEIAALLDEKMTQGMVLDEIFTRGILLKVLARMDADSLLPFFEKYETTGIVLSIELLNRMDEDSLLRLSEKSIKMSARTRTFMLLNLDALGMDCAEKVLNKLVEGSVKVSESDSDSGEPSRKISLDSRERAAISRMYNTLIERFCCAGELQRALSMFHQMKSHQIDAARSTCDAILFSLCRMGGIADARDLEKEMEKHGLSKYDDIEMERSKLGMLRGDMISWNRVYSWKWDGATL